MFLALFKLWFVILCCVSVPWAAFVTQYWWLYDSKWDGIHPAKLLIASGTKLLCYTFIAAASLSLGFWGITYVW